jgi:Ca2+-binding RTX toxin-like protein
MPAHLTTATTPYYDTTGTQTLNVTALHNIPLQGTLQHTLHDPGQDDSFSGYRGGGTTNTTHGDHFTDVHSLLNQFINPAALHDLKIEVAHDMTIYGTEGNDTLNGGAGNDTIYGLGGDDTINGGDGNDTLHGDGGSDHLYGGDGNDALYGGYGSDGDGQWDGDTLDGGAGNDFLQAGGGFTCTMNGGDGNDTLIGNAHSLDIMTGGTGADVFVSSGYADIVTDFSVAEGDRFQGHGGFAEFAGTATGSIDAEEFVQNLQDHGQLAGHTGNVFIYNEQTNMGYLVQDANGDGFFETSVQLQGCGHANDVTAASILYV